MAPCWYNCPEDVLRLVKFSLTPEMRLAKARRDLEALTLDKNAHFITVWTKFERAMEKAQVYDLRNKTRWIARKFDGIPHIKSSVQTFIGNRTSWVEIRRVLMEWWDAGEWTDDPEVQGQAVPTTATTIPTTAPPQDHEKQDSKRRRKNQDGSEMRSALEEIKAITFPTFGTSTYQQLQSIPNPIPMNPYPMIQGYQQVPSSSTAMGIPVLQAVQQQYVTPQITWIPQQQQQ